MSPVEVPAQVLAGLRRVFGEAAPLEQVRIIEHSRLCRLHLGAVATTRRRRIYLSGSAADFFGEPLLVLHEYCHVLLQWEPGRLTLSVGMRTSRLLAQSLRGGGAGVRAQVPGVVCGSACGRGRRIPSAVARLRCAQPSSASRR